MPPLRYFTVTVDYEHSFSDAVLFPENFVLSHILRAGVTAHPFRFVSISMSSLYELAEFSAWPGDAAKPSGAPRHYKVNGLDIMTRVNLFKYISLSMGLRYLFNSTDFHFPATADEDEQKFDFSKTVIRIELTGKW